jgi:kinesin family member 2/24
MASSASLTTTHLPTLRKLLDEWRERQPPAKPFVSPLLDIPAKLARENPEGGAQGKDIVVAFRTRPPLLNEAEKFTALEGKEEDAAAAENALLEVEDESPQARNDAPDDAAGPQKVDFCAGVTVKSAEPGTFVAHVPGWKVCSCFRSRL